MNEILKYPDPFLKTEAELVDNINTILVQSEIEYMTKIMKKLRMG